MTRSADANRGLRGKRVTLPSKLRIDWDAIMARYNAREVEDAARVKLRALEQRELRQLSGEA